jgi:pimeloyl-ACP methyl ester carboxylesterase
VTHLVRFGLASLNADAPPLVAIPGLDGAVGSIGPIVDRLAATREVLVVDFSDEQNPTLAGLSAEVAATIAAEGRPRIDILGQSIGTIVAAQVAANFGLPVRRVVLVSTFTVLRWRLLRIVAFLTRWSPGVVYRLTSGLTVALSCGPVGDGGNHPIFASARAANQHSVARRTRWEVGADFAPDVVAVAAPMLVLMGAKDRFVPNAKREIAKLHDLLRGRPARVEVIPRAGHVFLPSAAIALAADRIEAYLAAPDDTPDAVPTAGPPATQTEPATPVVPVEATR